MSKTQVTKQQIHHIAGLANIPLPANQEEKFATAFSETLEVVDQLKKIDVSKVEPTHQVTGLENVLREDVVDTKRMFTQAQALAGAQASTDGFFVVPQVIKQEEYA